jgi:two-component system, NarL family, sensor histidine kinase UhpB
MSERRLAVRLGLAVLIALAAYLSFWTIAAMLERAAKPAEFGSHTAISFVPLDKNGVILTALGPQSARYQQPYRFVSRLPDLHATAGRLELHFERPVSGSGNIAPDLSLILAKRVDVLNVRLNGQPLDAWIRSPRLSGSFASEPALYPLPTALLKAGRNTIELELRRSLRDPFLFPDYAIGPVKELLPVFQFRSIMIVEASIIGLAMMLLIALMCILVNWPNPEKAKMRAFVAALLSSFLLGAIFLFLSVERITFTPYALAHSLLSAILGFSSLTYASLDQGWSKQQVVRRTGWVCVLILVLSVALTLRFYTGLPERFWLHGFSIIAMLFAAFALISAVMLLIWNATGHGLAHLGERFVLIIWFGAVAFDRGEAGIFTMTSPFDSSLPLSLHWLPIMGTIVGLAMLTVLAKQASDAREVVYSANERLAADLAEREAELQKSYQEREQLLARHATETERQRIMRDMHDGLGSQLMSMLLAARRGDAEPVRVAEGLQSVIDEMRLMIDSMDSVGESLGSAFAIFRERVQPRVEQAGMRFVWQDQAKGALPHYSPRAVLQVFRIMQEAVTNALKHSGGSMLTVTLSPSPEPTFALRLTIADDGAGMSKTNPRGKGLASMAARASGIGGRLDVSAEGSGVAVLLDLPPAQNDSDMP